MSIHGYNLMYGNFNLPTKNTKLAKFHLFLFACFVGDMPLKS